MAAKTTHPKTQVIIIGAGPSGLSMAVALLRYKIDFIIIEKNIKTTHLSKAIAVQARTLEIFREVGLDERAVSEGRITTAFNVFYRGKQKAAVNIAGLGKSLRHFPYALSLEQSKTEKLLVDYLRERGKEVLWKSEFLHYQQNEDGVLVHYKDARGADQMIAADYVVGCDGAASSVRHQMGLSFEGDTVPRLFYVAEVKLNSPVINRDELFMFLIKKGFVLFFPMEGKGHYRIVGILPDRTVEADTVTFKDIETSLKKQIMSPVTFEEVPWFSTYKVHSRKANSFRNGRCFIAGDAAHIHTPAGGQGMNTGIQDAYNLAWKLAYTIIHKVDPAVLESYNTERMKNARHLLRTTDRMFDIMAGTTGFWNFIRLHLFPYVARFISKNSVFNKQIFPLISQTGIAYPESALTIKSSVGKIEAGDRMPYFVFADGSDIFDCLTEPAFKLLYFGEQPNNRMEPLKNKKLTVTTLTFTEIPKELFGTASDFYILLRPDNHISYIGKDINCCNSLLETIEGG